MKVYRPIKISEKMEAFKQYLEPCVAADLMGHVFEKLYPGCWSSEEAIIKHSKGQDLTGKTLLVMRRGGYGDLLWITRIARKLHEKYENLTVWVASEDRHHLVFTGNTDISKTISYPIPLDIFEAADYHLSFEQCIEIDRSGRSVFEQFAERAGITLARSEMIPIYRIPPVVSKMARKILKGFGIKPTDKRIMIHMGASTPWKSWPPDHIFTLAAALGSMGIKVILSGNKNVFKFKIPPIKNVYQTCYKLENGRRVDFGSMELSLALMARMDLLVGQDSSLTHFAAALNVPCIAIYGPFPACAYVDTYPSVEAIEPDPAVCDMQPCFPHTDNICRKIDHHGHAPCLKSISPELVLEKAKNKLGITMDPVNVKIRMVEAK